jgi:uncharacterized protein (DUF2235 family)
MKRLILCFDGTWNTLTKPDEATNVVRIAQAVKPVDSKGVPQVVYYNSGVGSGGYLDQILGGVFGVGVKGNVKRGLTFLSFNYDSGEPENEGDPVRTPDEIYIFGFSRGAYTARALAGVLGAIKGIPKVSKFGAAETLWAHYRQDPGKREEKKGEVQKIVYDMPADGKLIKCVAVWDTVGSYGIPSTGLSGLARRITSWTRNFRDNEIGRHIAHGFHAMAIDERRRAFTTTAWVEREKSNDEPSVVAEPKVEQVWFAGAHANVGGGYAQTGLSDHALLWIMARVQEETGLEFTDSYIQDNFFPCSACSSYRSYRGWWLSSLWPAIRSIPKRVSGAITGQPGQRILDGRVHWSVKERLGRLTLVDQNKYVQYKPKNLDAGLTDADYTKCVGMEQHWLSLCRLNKERDAPRQKCALHCDLAEMDRDWFGGRWRARRMRKLRASWEDVIKAANPEAP